MAYERPDPYRRDPGGPFDSLERETYARARARGATLKVAAAEAGVSPSSAYDFEKHEDIKARIRELRAGAETFIGVSMGWLLDQLKQNALEARKEGQYKASNEALAMIGKLLSRDPSRESEGARSLPADHAPDDVQRNLQTRFHARVRGRELVVVETSGAEVVRTRRAEGEG